MQPTCEKGASGKPFKILKKWLTARQKKKKSILHPEIQQHVIAKIKNKETLKSGLQWICINDDITT